MVPFLISRSNSSVPIAPFKPSAAAIAPAEALVGATMAFGWRLFGVMVACKWRLEMADLCGLQGRAGV